MGELERKSMPLGEFITSGCLQEINRQLLHPRGLAMAVHFDADTNPDESEADKWFVSIIDSRHDPDGFVMVPSEHQSAEDMWTKEANFIELLPREKKARRMSLMGAVVQPAGYLPPKLKEYLDAESQGNTHSER